MALAASNAAQPIRPVLLCAVLWLVACAGAVSAGELLEFPNGDSQTLSDGTTEGYPPAPLPEPVPDGNFVPPPDGADTSKSSNDPTSEERPVQRPLAIKAPPAKLLTTTKKPAKVTSTATAVIAATASCVGLAICLVMLLLVLICCCGVAVPLGIRRLLQRLPPCCRADEDGGCVGKASVALRGAVGRGPRREGASGNPMAGRNKPVSTQSDIGLPLPGTPSVFGDPTKINRYSNQPYTAKGVVPWTGNPPVLRGPQPGDMEPNFPEDGVRLSNHAARPTRTPGSHDWYKETDLISSTWVYDSY